MVAPCADMVQVSDNNSKTGILSLDSQRVQEGLGLIFLERKPFSPGPPVKLFVWMMRDQPP